MNIARSKRTATCPAVGARCRRFPRAWISWRNCPNIPTVHDGRHGFGPFFRPGGGSRLPDQDIQEPQVGETA